MARFILIDDHSGYIFADTADLNGEAARDETPAEAVARFLDTINQPHHSVEEHGPRFEPQGLSAFHVYRADIEGSEAISVVQDGQDQDTINTVERDCNKVAVVTYRSAFETMPPLVGVTRLV